jgi:hypothetical protein
LTTLLVLVSTFMIKGGYFPVPTGNVKADWDGAAGPGTTFLTAVPARARPIAADMAAEELLYLTNNPAWVANRQTVFGNVFCHHTARADNTIFSDSDPRQNQNARAKPCIITDVNRVSIFKSRYAFLHLERVFLRDDAHIRGDEHVVANRDFPAVHEFAIKIGKKVVTDGGIISVCTIKRIMYIRAFARAAEDIPQSCFSLLDIIQVNFVVLMHFFRSQKTVGAKFGVMRIVQKFRVGFFFFSHYRAFQIAVSLCIAARSVKRKCPITHRQRARLNRLAMNELTNLGAFAPLRLCVKKAN